MQRSIIIEDPDGRLVSTPLESRHPTSYNAKYSFYCENVLIVQIQRSKMFVQLPCRVQFYMSIAFLTAYAHAYPVCESPIYCYGHLIRTIQLANIYNDTLTFLRCNKLFSDDNILNNFAILMEKTEYEPSPDQLLDFMHDYFVNGTGVRLWMPSDFHLSSESTLLKKIRDPNLNNFARSLVNIWPRMGRKIREAVNLNPDPYSVIYVPNGFIVPGDRFMDLFYWDSYWTISGLLISNMLDTARGMIENLLYLVQKYGYVPNANRLYFLGRSQPPLLTAVVAKYFSYTQDRLWLRRNMATVEMELRYWLKAKTQTVTVKGKAYRLLHYINDRDQSGPRPEAYRTDYKNSRTIPSSARYRFYNEIKSAAESGWDFSSRWFVDANSSTGNLSDSHTTRILPVDLNAFFAGDLQLIGDLYSILMDKENAYYWWSRAYEWRKAIEVVLWDEENGSWFDYDMGLQVLNRKFYLSSVTPLWTGAVEKHEAPKFAARFVQYLRSSGALDYPGGVPVSMLFTNQQWDFPNAWPPLQSILIGGLERSGSQEAGLLARELAERWIRVNYLSYCRNETMFEKYCVLDAGCPGVGGEYEVQTGFGWTNGVVLELLQRYGEHFSVEPCEQALSRDQGCTASQCSTPGA